MGSVGSLCPAPVRQMPPWALPHTPLHTIPGGTQRLPQGLACTQQHRQTASAGSTHCLRRMDRGVTVMATLQLGEAETCSRSRREGGPGAARFPGARAVQAGRRVHTRVRAHARRRVRVCAHTVHTQPHWPSAGPRISFLGCLCPLPWAAVEWLLPEHQHLPGHSQTPGAAPTPGGVGWLQTLCPGLTIPLPGEFLSLENKTTSQSIGAELPHQ